jgi:hypothetical protein
LGFTDKVTADEELVHLEDICRSVIAADWSRSAEAITARLGG